MTDSPTSHQLAIIIPAYKSKFLREALQSVASQTDQRFQLYVGDDCSPEPVAEIVREFSGKLAVKYYRFEFNIGGTSLVRHWERCIRLTREPWVWIFSDDDLLDADCVAAFLAELEKTGGQHDLYRFNTIWIDQARNSVEPSPPHPLEETGVEFLVARLKGSRRSTLQELIFSRKAWEVLGGIPDFPLAWASDDAFIGKMGVRRRIRTIPGPCVTWRLSNVNISNDNSAEIVRSKLHASDEFVRWVVEFLDCQPPDDQKLNRMAIRRLSEDWLFALVNYWSGFQFIDLNACRRIENLATQVWQHKKGYGFFKALKINSTYFKRKFIGKIKRWKNGIQAA